MRKVPKLRFKEFRDEWEEEKLGNLITIKSGESPNNLVSENGIIPYFKVEQLNNSTKYQIETPYKILYNEKKLVKKGSIIFPKRGAAILLNKIRIIAQDSFMDTNLMTLTCNSNIYNEFLYYVILKEDLSKIADTTSIPQINNKHIEPFVIKVPLLQEQEKIANFLTNIDKKISLTEEKLELFREYKKGVMQKIFSQELRFKDSDDNDYPEWEEKKLEEVAECLDNLRKPLNSNEREKIKGSIPYYGANGIQGYINNYIFNEELVLLAEDGGNFDDYLTKPIAQYVQGKSWINNHAHVLKGKKVLKTKFLYFSLVHKDIRSFINGTSRSKLNKSSMLNIIILLPALEEQEKIADFLSSIDSKIENIEKELEGLKEFKKGLLQQMFV